MTHRVSRENSLEERIRELEDDRNAYADTVNHLEAKNERLREAIEDYLGLHCHEGWCDECCRAIGYAVYTEMFSYEPPRHIEDCRTAKLQAALRGKCPDCEGTGKTDVLKAEHEGKEYFYDCPECDGTGCTPVSPEGAET